ncbi:MAG: DNA polymerase I [Anaerolineaceae bacterium]|nr:DNA polymerase I [Anaerolineaceae bacterium]
MTKTLYLIDGHAIAYRAYFAITAGQDASRWMTPEGEPTAGTYGFASILLRLLENNHPDYLAVAFDIGKTFRNELFPAYKGTRAKMPDDLRPQITRMKELVDTLGVPRLEVDGFEADDVLGSTAKQMAAKGYNVKIITGDRDLLQLVDEKIVVSLPGGKMSDSKDYTPQMVKDFLGVMPDQVVDYKALVGDPSDNYPGVPGIGPKTAVTLLDTYGTLENIYANTDKLKGAVKTKIENNRESAFLSQNLARIRTDLPEYFQIEEASTANIDFPAMDRLFRTLHFNTLLPKLRKLSGSYQQDAEQPSLFGEATVPEEEEKAYENHTVIADNETVLEELAEKLRTAGMIALDTETTGVDPMSCEPVGFSFAVEPGTGYYIPVGHKSGEAQLPLETIREKLAPILADENLPKAGHNIKYDMIILARCGMPVKGVCFDSMIAGWILEPESRQLGLKPMAKSLLGIHMVEIETLIGKGKQQITMDRVPVKDAAPYAAADAEVVLQLVPVLRERMRKEQTEHIFEELEIPLIPVLAEMEMRGILLDREFLKQMSAELAERLVSLEKEIYDLVGYPFNINSTQQLSAALFNTLGLVPPRTAKKTSSGNYSTAADVLEEMRGEHPVIDKILEYREVGKLKSTYTDTLPESIDAVTGRVHTSFNQTGTVTGRLASNSPNLQNIPTRTELGKQIRTAFTAAPGCQLLSVDYSQIELRIVAHMSGDEAMISAFNAGQDIHAATAAAIYRCDISEVTKDQRRHAKAINFGLIYGMSAFGLSKSTGLTPSEASAFVKAYFEQFPKVNTFLDGLKREASEQGWVRTLAGRKRYFPNLKREMNYNLRNREEREAINAPVQGTSADILKAAMIKLPGELEKHGLHASILLQVHDELMLEVPEAELASTRQVVQNVMENITTLSVPLITEAKSGKNWGDLKSID